VVGEIGAQQLVEVRLPGRSATAIQSASLSGLPSLSASRASASSAGKSWGSGVRTASAVTGVASVAAAMGTTRRPSGSGSAVSGV
jgi:hypothetical protein